MKISDRYSGLAALGASAAAALPAWAQEAAGAAAAGPIKAPDAAAMAGMVDKGDVTWMLVSSALVLMMSIPSLALFYGGLVRTKNMLSLLMQVFMIVSICSILWVTVGYSLTFTAGSPFIGGLSKAFLANVGVGTYAATFSNNVYLPEYTFVIFQMTFAVITPALIIGAFAERVRFWPLMLFCALWSVLAYYPIAHMVWYWAGPDFLPDMPGDYGLLWGWGALDFAGGTVVHINAGIAGLVGAILIGRRVGYGRDNMAPHSMTLTMVGASMLWVGWFGFNAGSNLEANNGAALAMINTFTATAGAILAWIAIELALRGKASMLGAASGLVAGLVAVTPAAGFAGPVGAIVLGAGASAVCYWFVTVAKHRLGYDDSLDVFGIHGIGGIVGALGTAIVNSPALGGVGYGGLGMGRQFVIQLQGVLVTVAWCGVVSAVLYLLVRAVMGLRVSEENEREGLDLALHGERAYGA
jgi:Amt family ammonium transporter